MHNRKAFFEAVDQPASELDTTNCALLFSQALNPALDIQHHTAVLDSICHDAMNATIDNAEALLSFVHGKNRFRGNHDEYYQIENSLLDCVLEKRTGIPISLALVYLAIGKTSGLAVYGISFPGHFLVGVGTNSDATDSLIDPFAGRIVTRNQCFNLLDELYQGQVAHNDSYFTRCGNDIILLRLIENVKTIHLKNGEAENALTCLDYQLLIAPQDKNLLNQQQQLLHHIQKLGGNSSVVH